MTVGSQARDELLSLAPLPDALPGVYAAAVDTTLFAIEEKLRKIWSSKSVARLLVASDKDGTLDPHVADPARAFVRPEIVREIELLSTLRGEHSSALLDVEFVVVSGRSIAELKTLVSDRADIDLIGGHGQERCRATSLLAKREPSAAVRAQAALLREEAMRRLCLDLEKEFPSQNRREELVLKLLPPEKPYSVTVHGRAVGEEGESRLYPLARAALQAAFDATGAAGLLALVDSGDLVAEAMPRDGYTKGTAIAEKLSETQPDLLLVLCNDRNDLPLLTKARTLMPDNHVAVVVGPLLPEEAGVHRLPHPDAVYYLFRGLNRVGRRGLRAEENF